MAEELKKDHSVGAGTGAFAGALTGAAVGSVGGPIGSLVGAVAGGIVGAKAGDEIAEMVNPTEVAYNQHFETNYQTRPYYAQGYGWSDYQPAYAFGHQTYNRYRGHSFEEMEPTLARDWEQAKGHSRLAWAQAREAIRDGWHHVERTMPGDLDRDGR